MPHKKMGKGKGKGTRGRGREGKNHNKCQKCFEKSQGDVLRALKRSIILLKSKNVLCKGGSAHPAPSPEKYTCFKVADLGQKYEFLNLYTVHTHVLPSE